MKILLVDDKHVCRCVVEHIAPNAKVSAPMKLDEALAMMASEGLEFIVLELDVIGAGIDGRKASAHAAGSPLTPRQHDVLKLLAEGLSNKQIAYKLGISEATVKLHLNAMLKSLGVSNRTQALLAAQKKGLINSKKS